MQQEIVLENLALIAIDDEINDWLILYHDVYVMMGNISDLYYILQLILPEVYVYIRVRFLYLTSKKNIKRDMRTYFLTAQK